MIGYCWLYPHHIPIMGGMKNHGWFHTSAMNIINIAGSILARCDLFPDHHQKKSPNSLSNFCWRNLHVCLLLVKSVFCLAKSLIFSGSVPWFFESRHWRRTCWAWSKGPAMIFRVSHRDIHLGNLCKNLIAGWWFWTWLLFSPIVGMMIQSDFHIFQRGWNHHPDRAYVFLEQIQV